MNIEFCAFDGECLLERSLEIAGSVQVQAASLAIMQIADVIMAENIPSYMATWHMAT